MYKEQVDLLLEILPEAIGDPRVALKGGTAINLFFENMPRLSVDIDLCYLPIESRSKTLENIHELMIAMAEKLSKKERVLTQVNKTTSGFAKQILVQHNRTTVKVEINHVLRGHLYKPEILELCDVAQETFKQYAEVRSLSFEEVYAGKFCAALDRQHPRDLFDVHNFFQKHTITDKLKYAFIIYLISGNRPISEMIRPNLLDQSKTFQTEFEGMTVESVPYTTLEKARLRLIGSIDETLNEQDRAFLLSFKKGEPDWSHIPIFEARNMPAVQWKLINIQKMSPHSHKKSIDLLKEKLGF